MKHLNALTVKALATLSGISVRTLHYYDEIGLLTPERTASGYRVYGHNDVLKLQQILMQKSLGLSLSTIKSALDDPLFDNLTALEAHRKVLCSRLDDTHKMITAIDAAIAKLSNLEMETHMNIKAIFDGFAPEDYAAEAKESWGNTESYSMCQKRTRNYGQDDWQRIKCAEQSLWTDAAKAMVAGIEVSSTAAMDLMTRHRKHIDQWFYETSDLAYASLADIWESDPRFRQNIDQYGEGLTQWFAAAVRHHYGVIV